MRRDLSGEKEARRSRRPCLESQNGGNGEQQQRWHVERGHQDQESKERNHEQPLMMMKRQQRQVFAQMLWQRFLKSKRRQKGAQGFQREGRKGRGMGSGQKRERSPHTPDRCLSAALRRPAAGTALRVPLRCTSGWYRRALAGSIASMHLDQE